MLDPWDRARADSRRARRRTDDQPRAPRTVDPVPPGHLHIPALPVLLPLGIILMALGSLWLRRRTRPTAPRLAVVWLAGWYAVAVLGATMLPLRLAWGPGTGEPHYDQILLNPFVPLRLDDVLLNTLMFLPLASLLHLLAGVRDGRRIVRTGLLISATIEVTQLLLLLFLHGTRWFDVDDLIANTLGSWLGLVLWRRLLRREAVRRTAEDCAVTAQYERACS